MLFTHHFASFETMDRAQYWLTWHGYAVEQVRPVAGSAVARPALMVHASPASGAAVRMLIDSIEESAPGAEEAFATRSWVAHASISTGPTGSSQPAGSPIHWQATPEPTDDPAAASVAEYMFSRWE